MEKPPLKLQKPREQVADSEALLGLANTLATSAKSHSVGGFTSSDFVTYLLRNFGKNSSEIDWNGVGLSVSNIFMKAHGSTTMVGPMSTAMEKCFLKATMRKPRTYTKRSRPTETSQPEKLVFLTKTSEKYMSVLISFHLRLEFLGLQALCVHVYQFDAGTEEKTDTHDDISTMFNILKKKPGVVKESLILNRNSFPQTVENLLALSFLVRDGRVGITVDKNSRQLGQGTLPMQIQSRQEILDYKDWELMKGVVAVGEELMPHRGGVPVARVASPIRNISRNRTVAVAEQISPTVVKVCSEKEYNAAIQNQPFVTVVKD
ncbi:hypothetical protein F8388_005300 [Cannabis sativa]|uniref:Non-structural maintenance of chromosomes element 4 n=1 Tax=Cannabis sativa TaxID=3483 RepID=A0A7J6ELG6_CANSA|nr:hypothetical protein F8388_005300 [Cannabis sativa]